MRLVDCGDLGSTGNSTFPFLSVGIGAPRRMKLTLPRGRDCAPMCTRCPVLLTTPLATLAISPTVAFTFTATLTFTATATGHQATNR